MILAMLLRKFKFAHPKGTDMGKMFESTVIITSSPVAEVDLEITERA